MNGIELFTKLYNNELKENACIKVIHPNEEDHYLLRDNWNNFDEDELIGCLLYTEYKFEIKNQRNVEIYLQNKNKKAKIEKLKKELELLEGDK